MSFLNLAPFGLTLILVPYPCRREKKGDALAKAHIKGQTWPGDAQCPLRTCDRKIKNTKILGLTPWRLG